MIRLNDIGEALNYLRDGEILTSNGKDQFILKNERVYRYDSGTHFSLDVKDFYDLYKKTVFYLYEDSVEIDLEKDEAYYRYYKKQKYFFYFFLNVIPRIVPEMPPMI